MLKQPGEDGVEDPVAHHSHALFKYEQKYATTELEYPASVDGVDRWH